MQVATAVPLVLVGLLLFMEAPTFARRRREARSRDGGSYWVMHIGIAVAYGLAFTLSRWRPFGFSTRLSTSYVLAGAVLFLMGAAIRYWAIRELGRLFTRDVQVSEGQTIVAQGPFRWMRHPSYTGLLLEAAGIGLAVRSGFSTFVIVAIVLAAVLYRVRIEERALAEVVGPAYAAYARRVRRFVPFIV